MTGKGDDPKKSSNVNKTIGQVNGTRLSILPNPTNGNFVLNYTARENGKVVVQVTNVEGKIVLTSAEGVNKGQNIIYMQSSSAWKAGIYLITVRQGKIIQKAKLLYE